MSFLLNPHELKDDIISTLNILFEHNDNDYINTIYTRKHFISSIEHYLNNIQCYFKPFDSIDIIKICNYINSIIQNKFMNKIISKYKELLLNSNDDNCRLFNNELLSLSINKPYNEELYKSTILTLYHPSNVWRHCLYFGEIINNIDNNLHDNIHYICFYINNFKEKTQKELKDLKKTININENNKEIKELKQTIYFFKKELNLIIDNYKKENEKEIEEIKETIDNNQKENKKDINKLKQNIYFCKKEIKEIIENCKKENQKEIENIKEIIENCKKENQKEIENIKEINNNNNKEEIENLKQIIENNKKNNNREINRLKYVLLISFIYKCCSIIIYNT